MPSLVLCGRPTFVAGDDLRTPTLIALLLRVIQVVVLLPIYVYTYRSSSIDVDSDEEDCPVKRSNLISKGREIIIAYVALSTALAYLGIFLELAIHKTARRGTPTQPELRNRTLIPLCHVKLIPMAALRVVNLVLGFLTVFIIRQYCHCDGQLNLSRCPQYNKWYSWLKTLVSTNVAEACFLALIAIYFGCKFKPKFRNSVGVGNNSSMRICCKCCCTITTLLSCCLYGRPGAGDDLAEIAIVLSHYLEGGKTVDVTISDIWVGLRMLGRVQKKRHEECRSQVVNRASIFCRRPNALAHPQQQHIQQMDVVMDKEKKNDGDGDKNDTFELDPELAKSVLQHQAERLDDQEDVFETPTTAAVSVSTNRRRSLVLQASRRQDGELRYTPTERRNLSRKNAQDKFAIAQGARFIRFANGVYLFRKPGRLEKCIGETEQDIYQKTLTAVGLSDVEIVYHQCQEEGALIPYCIAIDHAWKCIVVAIRGTVSMDDIIADLQLKPSTIEAWGERCNFDSRGCYVHSGMLTNTSWIYEDIER